MEITFKGKPVALTGKPLRVGDAMPDFALTDSSLATVRGAALTGVRVFLTVPSLDTDVCDAEVRRFNEEAAALPGVSVFAVSMDLPFAAARWCGAAGVNNVRVLSDYKDHSFGRATGTRLEELGLLTRAVFIVNQSGKIAYAEYVPEVADHPDYAAAIGCLKTQFV